jgi:hypothetical protein
MRGGRGPIGKIEVPEVSEVPEGYGLRGWCRQCNRKIYTNQKTIYQGEKKLSVLLYTCDCEVSDAEVPLSTESMTTVLTRHRPPNLDPKPVSEGPIVNYRFLINLKKVADDLGIPPSVTITTTKPHHPQFSAPLGVYNSRLFPPLPYGLGTSAPSAGDSVKSVPNTGPSTPGTLSSPNVPPADGKPFSDQETLPLDP